jgi:FlaA1/EpsC-like NDP-sugar epimerase
MISTDKAVNPAGVMGATKRVCELLVANAAIESGRRYLSVRFGNVLGSSGSLIPVLKKQIQEGGPVTITHPDMTRFFILIPEAVSLVLKAGAIAAPGDVNVLRMGDPVRVVDVAKSLIALMGKSEPEIPIAFTGLRPGEKMFEELYIRGDELQTEDPDILTLPNGDSTLAASSDERHLLLARVARMLDAAPISSKDALFELNQIVQSNYATIGSLTESSWPNRKSGGNVPKGH